MEEELFLRDKNSNNDSKPNQTDTVNVAATDKRGGMIKNDVPEGREFLGGGSLIIELNCDCMQRYNL